MRALLPQVALPFAGALAAATVPPLAMAALWATLSGAPGRFLAETGAGGLGDFVLSQQRFFLPVVAAGLGAHAVLACLHRCHALFYALAFYCIGAVVYVVGALPQLAAFALEPPVVRTLAGDALLRWAPLAGLSGLVFWLIAGRPRRGR